MDRAPATLMIEGIAPGTAEKVLTVLYAHDLGMEYMREDDLDDTMDLAANPIRYVDNEAAVGFAGHGIVDALIALGVTFRLWCDPAPYGGELGEAVYHVPTLGTAWFDCDGNGNLYAPLDKLDRVVGSGAAHLLAYERMTNFTIRNWFAENDALRGCLKKQGLTAL